MWFSISRAAILGLFCAAATFAQQSLTVEKLKGFISSSISMKVPDKDVAQSLTGFRMTEKLDIKVVEELQRTGAGPKTVAALSHMAEVSATLTPPAPKAAAAAKAPERPAPAYEEQQQVLSEAREYALNYSKTLPDFLCLQVTHRYGDRNYKAGTEGSWSPLDRVAAKVSYFEQNEKYELLSEGDKSLFGKNFEALGGTISTGEFGSVLREIFEPQSHTEFHFDHWGTMRGHLSYVYRYAIEQPYSQRVVDYNHQQQTTPGYHGLVYVQKGSNAILRVTVEPEMPGSFPIQEIHQVIDYNYVDISGQQFLLPYSANLVMRHDRDGTKNEIDFRGYRKYSADTSITFDDTDSDAPADAKKPEPSKPELPRK